MQFHETGIIEWKMKKEIIYEANTKKKNKSVNLIKLKNDYKY